MLTIRPASGGGGPHRPVPERAVAAPAVEARLMVLAALAMLPPKARAVVVLRYWADMSVDLVAAVLGCSAGNVRSQSTRAPCSRPPRACTAGAPAKPPGQVGFDWWQECSLGDARRHATRLGLWIAQTSQSGRRYRRRRLRRPCRAHRTRRPDNRAPTRLPTRCPARRYPHLTLCTNGSQITRRGLVRCVSSGN